MVTYEMGLSHSISVSEETMLANWLHPKFSTIYDNTNSNNTTKLNKTEEIPVGL